MIKINNSFNNMETDKLKSFLKTELEKLDIADLPLQQGLANSSYVADAPFSVIILKHDKLGKLIKVKAGICYSGIIAGCSCADDPTPLDEVTEYCEIEVSIDQDTGKTEISLID